MPAAELGQNVLLGAQIDPAGGGATLQPNVVHVAVALQSLQSTEPYSHCSGTCAHGVPSAGAAAGQRTTPPLSSMAAPSVDASAGAVEELEPQLAIPTPTASAAPIATKPPAKRMLRSYTAELAFVYPGRNILRARQDRLNTQAST
jgi:hypothetical protein